MLIEIKKAGINGEGIGFYKRKPVFVEGCYPNETIDCKLYDEGSHYRGELIKVIKKSEFRVKVPCIHQKRCGGCALMSVSYDEQLRIKKQLLESALLKYMHRKIDVGDVVPSDKQLFYRNKCNLPVIEKDGRLINALYAPNSNHPVYIDSCMIHEQIVEEIRKEVLNVLNRHKYKVYDHHLKKGIRQIVIRGFENEYQLVLITGNDKIDDKTIEDLNKIDNLVSIFQGINTHKNPVNMMPDNLRKLSGKDKINVKINSFRLKLSPQAFFQLNKSQAEQIYSDVNNLIDSKVNCLVEAYCGIGAMSLSMHDKADELYGIEIVDKAIRDAKDNARINKIDNITYICGDASYEVRKLSKNKKIDVLIVDPPRTGLDDDLLVTILKSKIKKVIYVSCNPSTLAKNLDILSDKYQIDYIKGYDMFPNTPHVEAIVLLCRAEC